MDIHPCMRTSAYYTFIMPAWFTKRYKVDTYIPWIITKFVPKNVFIYSKISFSVSINDSKKLILVIINPSHKFILLLSDITSSP